MSYVYLQQFDQWFLDNAPAGNPPITLLDTSRISIEAAAEAARDWIGKHWIISQEDT